MISKPAALDEAELIDGLCQRYHCLPSALLAEDVSVIKMLAIVALGRPPELE